MSFRWVAFALALFASALSWTAESQARPHPRGGTHLYVLLGLGNNSPGLAEFGYRMQQYGIPTTVANHGDEPSLARQAIEAYKSGQVGSIKIVGHSLGGDAAIDMASELAHAGVPVQLVITLDPVSRPGVPSNVRRFANFVPRPGEDHFTMIAGRRRELAAYVLGR
ncbi:MAG: hypothetical protein K2W78_03470 [Xanthobacteraceae bacterium]|nr:hypothetical protein [Xanthobacteraceae bacterium]